MCSTYQFSFQWSFILQSNNKRHVTQLLVREGKKLSIDALVFNVLATINVNQNSAKKEYARKEINYMKDVNFEQSTAAATTKGMAIQATDVLLYNVILMETVNPWNVNRVQIHSLISVPQICKIIVILIQEPVLIERVLECYIIESQLIDALESIVSLDMIAIPIIVMLNQGNVAFWMIGSELLIKNQVTFNV